MLWYESIAGRHLERVELTHAIRNREDVDRQHDDPAPGARSTVDTIRGIECAHKSHAYEED